MLSTKNSRCLLNLQLVKVGAFLSHGVYCYYEVDGSVVIRIALSGKDLRNTCVLNRWRKTGRDADD